MTCVNDCCEFANDFVSRTPIIEVKRNIDTTVLCQSITQTSVKCNVVTVMGGKYIIIKNNDIQDAPFYTEIETVTEVDNMENNMLIKVKSIYNLALMISCLLIMVATLCLRFKIFNIPAEVLISILFFSIVGLISFGIDYIQFSRNNLNK